MQCLIHASKSFGLLVGVIFVINSFQYITYGVYISHLFCLGEWIAGSVCMHNAKTLVDGYEAKNQSVRAK